MGVLIVPAQGIGEKQRSRITGPLAACGKEREEVVVGRKAPEEEIGVEAGVSLLLL